MPYLTLGSASQLVIKVPTNGTTDWGDTLKSDTFQKIAEHNHTGSGTGSKLGTGSIIADAITGALIRLDNDEYLRARNAANSANIDIVKVNSSDKVAFGTDIAVLDLTNNTYLRARNAADSGYINIAKVNASDKTEFSATIASATFDALTPTQINAGGTATLTDNTAVAADASVITLASNETCTIEAKLARGAVREKVTIELDQANATIIESTRGGDCGVTFSIASDQLQYTTTSTGANVTMTYTIIKE